MAEKLAYQSPKWEKEQQQDVKRYKQLKGLDPIIKNMEFVISSHKNKLPEERNYVRCYTSLQLKYRMLAERAYLRDNADSQAIHYTYLSGMAAIFSYLFDIQNPPIERNQTDQKDMVYDFSYGIYQLFAVQGSLPQCLAQVEHPEVQLFLGNFEKAVELLSITSSTYDSTKPYTVLMGDMGQSTVRAMADRDEKTLKDLLIRHIKAYRKQLLGYSTFIDSYSIAYIKLAHQYGMECDLDIIEIPKMFFDPEVCKRNTEEVKLPFFNDAVEQLKKLGVTWS